MKRIVFLLLIFPACLWGYDFGVNLNQDFGYEGIGSNSEIDYSAALIPYFSTSFGDSTDLYISAWIKTTYEYEELTYIGEFLHTEFSWRSNDFKIRIGRIPYAAPLDFIVEGFFDGVQTLYDTKIGTFNVGGWYTGLLYKRTANITMTPEDYISYYTSLDYGDFAKTYFASRRVLLAAGWENPAIADMVRVRTSVLGQFDLNDTDFPYNSMYVTAKTAIPFKRFIVSAGGCMQLAKLNDETKVGLAGELGCSWIVPASFYSRLSLTGRFGSGKTDSIYPFVPVTTKPQGNVLQANLSGISAFFLDYTAQLHPTVSAGLTASYFIRSDEGTYTAYPVMNPADGGKVLGCEFFGRTVWSPFTDLSMSLGAGIFLPSLGNANKEAGTQWRLELGVILAIY